jgi:Fanconi anemia group M protein
MNGMNQGALQAGELDFTAQKKEDDNKIIKIYADTREARSGVIKALQAMENVQVTVVELPCGDYILSPEVAVERKSATDFVNSVMSGHIFEQVARMKIDYIRPMVLIEGDPIRTRSAIKPEAVAGAMSSLMTIQLISLVSVADVNETAIMIATMARHLQHGLGYEINLHPKKPKPTQDAKNYVISSLPGLGTSTSAKLLAHFGTIHSVINASMAQIMGVKGIGPKTAARIFELIHHP